MPDTTLSQQTIKLEKENELKLYKNEAFDGDRTLNRKPHHALSCVQCPPLPEFANEQLSSMNCARSVCPNCPTYKQPDLKTRLGLGDRKIFFTIICYFRLVVVVDHSKKGTTECTTCLLLKGKSKLGKFTDAKHLLLNHEPFDLFWKDYYATIFHLPIAVV